MIRKIKNFMTDSEIRFSYLAKLGLFNHMADEKYLKKKWKSIFRYDLNLENPKTFNEKLQWLKLHDRKPEYTMMVDKYKVREYIADKIGEEYLIPLVGVWDDPDEIDFDALPNQFVLKCNHNSGTGMCICKDKSKLDIKKVKKELRKGLKENYYLLSREWPYKNVPRKIICEKYMFNKDSPEIGIADYKFFVFNGKCKVFFIATDREIKNEETKFDFYNMKFEHLPFTNGHPNAQYKQKKPEKFEEMKKLAEILSENIPQARIDFYEVNGKIYFGEITLFHWSGFKAYNPSKWDYKFGKWIRLPKR